MRLALWTPFAAGPLARLATELGRRVELQLVTSEPLDAPHVAIDLYHLADAPEHGFVFRALVRRPGIVLLADWGLHALVHAETAGDGDAAGYLREARHAHGDTGVFVARQVLGSVGGALTSRFAMNQRVLDASLAVAVLDDELRARAAARLRGREVVSLRLDAPAAAADAVAALGERVAPGAEAFRLAFAERLAAERGPSGFAADELDWTARELGLAEAPADARALVAGLFGRAR